MKLFTFERRGMFVTEPRGEGNIPHAQVVSMDGAHGKTIAEVFHARKTDKAITATDYKHWQDFAEWYSKQ